MSGDCQRGNALQRVRRREAAAADADSRCRGCSAPAPTEPSDQEHVAERKVGPVTVHGDGPLVVREKSHAATPMTLEQALYEMELVGHDFYLFHDRECDRFSVVYRRRGYDYGVIRLVEE